MPIERTAKCPQCGRPVRLTEEELMSKRGFCAVCDARFDLLPELFIGEGPMRSLVVPQVAEIAKPTTSRIVEEAGCFILRPTGAPRILLFGMSLLAAFALTMVAFVVSSPPEIAGLAAATGFGMAAILATWREECWFDADSL